MRLRIPAAVLIVVALGAPSASAQLLEDQSLWWGRRTGPQMPWCSNQNTGERVEEDCSFMSFAHCRQMAMGANNTFCTMNPRYDVSIQPVRSRKGDRLPRQRSSP